MDDLFSETVPFVASGTFTGPFGRFVTTVFAEERFFDFAHAVKVENGKR